jgi:hypothetical protein
LFELVLPTWMRSRTLDVPQAGGSVEGRLKARPYNAAVVAAGILACH